MTPEASIILGVVSGILTSLIIYLCVTTFNKLLIPWYRGAIYRGLDISGTWNETVVHDNSDITDYIILSLNQKEQHVSGVMTVVKSQDNDDNKETKLLTVRGTFQDGHLMLTGKNKDKKIQSYVTYLLKVTQGGHSLTGHNSLVDSGNGNICSRGSRLHRKNT